MEEKISKTQLAVCPRGISAVFVNILPKKVR